MNNIINRVKNIRYEKHEKFIIACLVILGLVVRLYKINNPIADWHSFRQADTASVTRMFIDKGVNLLIPTYHDISKVQSGLANPQGYRFVEFPIFNLFHVVFARALPFLSLEANGRLVSIIFSLIASLCLYVIGKKLYGRTFGLIVFAGYLFLPFNVYFTRVILPDPLAVSFSLISLMFFVFFRERKKAVFLFASVVCLSLGILVKPYVFFYGFPIVWYFIENFGVKKLILRKEIWLSGVIILTPFILWRLWISQFPEGIPFWKWTLNGDGIRFKPAFWNWLMAERIGRLIFGVWGLFPFAFGLATLNKKDNFLASLVVGAFIYLGVFATANVRHDYYQTLIVPVLILVFAKGVASLWDLAKNSKIISSGRLVLAFSLFIMVISSAIQAREYYKINHPEIVDAGRAVDRLVPKDALVIAAYNGDTAFLYQTKRRGWPVVELPINELIDKGASYYTSVNLNDTQTQEFIKRFTVVEKTATYVVLDLTKEDK